jgi:hypothetical protein
MAFVYGPAKVRMISCASKLLFNKYILYMVHIINFLSPPLNFTRWGCNEKPPPTSPVLGSIKEGANKKSPPYQTDFFMD